MVIWNHLSLRAAAAFEFVVCLFPFGGSSIPSLHECVCVCVCVCVLGSIEFEWS